MFPHSHGWEDGYQHCRGMMSYVRTSGSCRQLYHDASGINKTIDLAPGSRRHVMFVPCMFMGDQLVVGRLAVVLLIISRHLSCADEVLYTVVISYGNSPQMFFI
jgi:hypothetical protein